MTGLSRVFDAAYPPAQAPAGCAGVLGYIGGQRATNIWTLEEWQRFGHLVQFPAYVPDFVGTDKYPVDTARYAATLMRGLGWAPFQPARRVVVVDLETVVERTWYRDFAAECEQQGFSACAYGSLSTVLENAASDVWVASWDGNPVLLPGQTIHAHQYFAGNTLDYSVVDEWLFARSGKGPRHA